MSRLSSLIAAIVVFAVAGAPLGAQNPLEHPADAIEARYSLSQPVVAYTLRVKPDDLSGFDVEIRIRNAPDTFRLAMVAHPEYDDRFWRFVEGLTVTTPKAAGSVTREDRALWRVTAPGGESVVRYRIRLPTGERSPRAAWRPFLAPTGALVGGPQSFMYVVGATLTPSHVKLDLPTGWDIATALEPTSDSTVFFAPSVGVLTDSPILTGKLRSWKFITDGVPHRIVYWPLPTATPFDTAALINGVQRITREAIRLFGRAPYRDYTFLFQDGAYGALEHASSVTVGAPSTELATNSVDLLEEIAHEFFHAWNLVRIRPAEYGDVDYRPSPESRGLWWSEGLTLFYADLLLRRAALPVHDSTRIAHLRGLIARYLGSGGDSHISPERVSLVSNATVPGGLGDYSASPHLQGELLGAMLDLIVRDATNGQRSIDDVMRAMLEHYSGQHGFYGRDIERKVSAVCGCHVKTFFDSHVRGSTPIDFDRYLRLIGLRTSVKWSAAVDEAGKPQIDYRLWAWAPPGERRLMLLVSDPTSIWARAGLHTGDRLVAVDGTPITAMPDFRILLRELHIGQTIKFDVSRPGGPFSSTVTVSGYQSPVVSIDAIPGATDLQRKLRDRWRASLP